MSTLPSGPGISDEHHLAPAPADAGQPLDGSPKALRRRRRLWDLPTQAHELLLATSFRPEELRREAARTLGQMHHGVCKLQGMVGDNYLGRPYPTTGLPPGTLSRC